MKSDRLHEEYYWRAFSTFEIPDPSLDSNLTEWVRSYPGCANAYAARAGYYMTVGWNIRGYGWANQVGKDQWDGMMRYFRKASLDALRGLKLDPDNLECYNVLLNISMNVASSNTTASVFNAALKVDPGCVETWAAYMWSLLPRWGGSHEKMRLLADLSDKYLSVNPRLKVLHGYVAFDEGWALEDEGDYDAAAAKYTKAISFGKAGAFYYHRGLCYYEMKEYNGALGDFEEALRIIPQNADYLCVKADALYEIGAIKNAREAAEEASQISPTDSDVRDTQKFLNSEGAEATTYDKQGCDMMTGKEYGAAVEMFDRSIAADGRDYVAYYNRGVCYEHLERYNEALSDLQTAVVLHPQYYLAYINIGWIHYQEGKYRDGVTDFSNAIEANPNEYDGYYDRALCYLRLRDRADVLNDLKQACDMGYDKACEGYNRLGGK